MTRDEYDWLADEPAMEVFSEGEDVEAIKPNARYRRWHKAKVLIAFTADKMNRYRVEFRDGSIAHLFAEAIRRPEKKP